MRLDRGCVALLLITACSVEVGVEPPPGGGDGATRDVAVGEAGVDARDSSGPLDGRVDGARDAAPVDTGPGDTSATDSAPPDTGPADTGPVDTGPVDTGPVDTGPVDTGPVDTGPPPRMSCVAAYGSESSYFLCDMRATECEFYVDAGGDSCGQICARGGGTCAGTYSESGDSGGDRCVRSSTRTCEATGSNDFICICTRPFA